MDRARKILIISATTLVLAFFWPVQRTPAAIFEGTESSTGAQFGSCIDVDLTAHPECVDCKDAKNAADPRCISESQAGTGLAKTSLASTGITHTENFGDYIKKLVNFSLPYLTLAAFIGYVAAGFIYVTAFGNEQMMEKAKKILIWSTIGLLLVILSYAITTLFTNQLVTGLAG